MGFFKSIGRALGRTVGKAVEKVGDFLGNDKMYLKGIEIQCACAEEISSERSYDKTEADIYTTNRLNEILVSFSEGYLQYATMIENNCSVKVEEYYNQIISVIESSKGTVYNNSNIKALKNDKKRLVNKISGAIKEPLAKRMSLDDGECLSILKMDSGNDKKNAMKKFAKKVIDEALENLSKNVRETLREQNEDIGDYLNNLLEEEENKITVLKNYIDNMLEKDNIEQIDKEKICIQPLVVIESVEKVLEIIK